jgi:hypothetical protein
MSDAALRHTIHFAIARALGRLIGYSDKPPELKGKSFLATCILSADPDDRHHYVHGVAVGWLVLGVSCGVAMLMFGIPIQLLFGDTASNVVVDLFLAGLVFCVAGAFNASWRMSWYVSQARRRASEDGVDSERFARSMRRTLPRNSSLIFQTAAAILTLILAL